MSGRALPLIRDLLRILLATARILNTKAQGGLFPGKNNQAGFKKKIIFMGSIDTNKEFCQELLNFCSVIYNLQT